MGSNLNCAGSLCLKVLHCNQFQSLTLTTLYRHTVGFCRIVDRLQVAVVILVLVLLSLRCFFCLDLGLCKIVVDCVKRWKEWGEAGGEGRVRGGLPLNCDRSKSQQFSSNFGVDHNFGAILNIGSGAWPSVGHRTKAGFHDCDAVVQSGPI